MKTFIILLLVAVTLQAADRIVLFEDHTNAQCGPCWNIEPQINAFVNSHLAAGDLAVLRTHAWWPGPDPIYNANPIEQKDRIEFYNISGVPSLKMDGILPTFGSNLEARFDIRAGTACYLNIEVTKNNTDVNGTIYIKLTAEQALTSSPLKLQAVFVEDNVPGTGYWSSTVFEQAFRDNICPREGQDVDFGSSYPSTLYFEFPYSTDSWVDDNVHLTVFVQNTGNKEVYNAWYSAVLDIPQNNGVEGSISDELSISISSNPNNGSFTVNHPNASGNSTKITLYDIFGREIETKTLIGEESSFTVNNSGLYLVVVNTTDGRVLTERVVVTK